MATRMLRVDVGFYEQLNELEARVGIPKTRATRMIGEMMKYDKILIQHIEKKRGRNNFILRFPKEEGGFRI